MAIRALRLKETYAPERTALYEVRNSRDIEVKESQEDGAKVIDITAVMLNHTTQNVRWHLCDIKDTLAGETTVCKLYNQWNASLAYLKRNILEQVPGYSEIPNLGVITRCYDEERMIRLKDNLQKVCAETEAERQELSLAKQKRRTNIAKDRAALKAANAILEKSFQPDEGADTYEICIRFLCKENDNVYSMRFSV